MFQEKFKENKPKSTQKGTPIGAVSNKKVLLLKI
jgi:hypothetical protein